MVIKQFMLGFGTGRNGSSSLAKLINDCEDCNIFHEMEVEPRILPWVFDESLAYQKLNVLEHMEGDLVGDVAFYYLNYIDFFIEHLSNLKTVCTYRDKSEVIESYMWKTRQRRGSKNHHHWIDNPQDLGYAEPNRWHYAYPKYRHITHKEESIALYWEEYKWKVQKLIKKYPDKIISLDIYDLNKKEFQDKIFNFLEIPIENRVYQKVKENKGNYNNKGE